MNKKDKKQTKIAIQWCGFKSGPRFVEILSNCSSKKRQRTRSLDKMTDEFMTQAQQQDDLFQFGKDMQQFAEDRGFVVVKNDYTEIEDDVEDFLDESLSGRQEKEFLKLLKRGEVKFKYVKAENGKVRQARGTLKKELIPTQPSSSKLKAKKKKRLIPPTILIYYDLDKNSFRCFRKSNFLSYDKNVVKEEDKIIAVVPSKKKKEKKKKTTTKKKKLLKKKRRKTLKARH